MIFTIRDLFEKYDEQTAQKIYNEHLKKHGCRNKKRIRFFGKQEKEKFLEEYQKMDDVEKLKYFDFEWHSIPLDDEFPSYNWQWVFDVWCWEN